MAEPYAAATVIVVREMTTQWELFMLRRSSTSSFMPDIFVFPGGRVEPQDRSADAISCLSNPTGALSPGIAYAAARETFEECGLLFATDLIDATILAANRVRILAGTYTFTQMLVDFGTRVDAAALHYFSRWITPPSEQRRFDTHFFLGRAPRDQIACADASETHDGIWISPRDALARYAAGTFALIFPTIKHLERLLTFDSIEALFTYTARKPIQLVVPEVGADRAFTIPALLEGVW